MDRATFVLRIKNLQGGAMQLRKFIGCLLIGASLQASAAHALVYSVDDGSTEAFLAFLAGPGTFGNHFTAVAGGQTIESISITWGSFGDAVTAKLWSDPNGDGNPNDALVLSSVAGVTGGFTTYDIPDVTLLVGQSFFVGGTLAAGGAIGLDTTPPISNEGWFTGDADFLGSAPNNSGTALGAELMVRANATGPAAVAEPTSLSLLAISLLGFGLARRARSRGKEAVVL
jgi:hypothetical protein